MNYAVCKAHASNGKKMSEMYFTSMMQAMEKDRRVMHIEADLGLSILGAPLYDMMAAHPDQIINCGIQEANAVGVASGLSIAGKVPFVHSFAPFIARRACDQAFLSCCYAGANVKLLGSDGGICAAFNGGTHMPFEDLGIMRTFPELTIVEPSDAVMTQWLIPAAIEHRGNMYIRLSRKNDTPIYEEGSSFEFGKANLLREGDDVSIIASGIMVETALQAAELLSEQGVQARVVDMFTIKPIDVEMILDCAEKTGAIVTAENHNVINGLGSAVADVLAQNVCCPLEKIGVQDQFGQVGPMPYLREFYHLTPEDICDKARKAISRKG